MNDRPDCLSDIPEQNVMADCQSLHAELLDLTAGTVWQSQQAISREAYEALVLPADVGDPEQIHEAVAKTLETYGQVDALLEWFQVASHDLKIVSL